MQAVADPLDSRKDLSCHRSRDLTTQGFSATPAIPHSKLGTQFIQCSDCGLGENILIFRCGGSSFMQSIVSFFLRTKFHIRPLRVLVPLLLVTRACILVLDYSLWSAAAIGITSKDMSVKANQFLSSTVLMVSLLHADSNDKIRIGILFEVAPGEVVLRAYAALVLIAMRVP